MLAGGFAGAATEFAVGTRGGDLGFAAGGSAGRAEAGGHPFAGAEVALHQGGDVELSVEKGEVDAELRGCDLDLFELSCGGVLQALGDFRRKAEPCIAAQNNYDVAKFCVIASLNDVRFVEESLT